MNNYKWKNHFIAKIYLQHVSFAFNSIICKIANFGGNFFQESQIHEFLFSQVFNELLHCSSIFDNVRSLELDKIATLNIFETNLPY